jgi:hypothetical protein
MHTAYADTLLQLTSGDLEGSGVMRHAQTSTIAVLSALAAQAHVTYAPSRL